MHSKNYSPSNSKKFKVYLEYDGTRYSGWQKQPNARTVQGELLKVANVLFNDDRIDIQGSGRTDGGVHAICQVAHLEVRTMLAPEIIRLKMNDGLPHDINILEIEKTSGDFHARHSAVRRSYIYQISRRRTAFGKNYVWWIKDKLDIKKMESASKLFLGMNDFSSFCEQDSEEKSTKVLIEDIQLKEDGDLILIHITGSHFLWKMVRRIVGILVEVGRGNMKSDKIIFYLNNHSKEPAKYTAPPSGLFLEKVFYEKEKVAEFPQSLFTIKRFTANK